MNFSAEKSPSKFSSSEVLMASKKVSMLIFAPFEFLLDKSLTTACNLLLLIIFINGFVVVVI